MAFVMRTTKPEKGNKYYITQSAGGYSRAIVGNPTDKDCNVLHNCVGYAYGRFNEIAGLGYCKYLAPTNAENFIDYKGTCTVGMAPKVGSCMVWQKGATRNGSDGAGHVAIVEKVINDTEVYTSESGWGSSLPFWNQTRKKGADGRWGCGSAYTFLGFIYNPALESSTSESSSSSTSTSSQLNDSNESGDVLMPTICIGSKGSCVRTMQILLIGNDCDCGPAGADGDCGSGTAAAIGKFQEKVGLPVDRVCGKQTWNKLLGLS